MSGRSGASGSVRSSGATNSLRLGPEAGAHKFVLDALYERKRDNRSVRVLTVVIYVFCVSLAAIMLSLYYVFFWEPKDAQYAQRKVLHTVDLQTSTTPMPTCFNPYTGGNNTKMNDTTLPPFNYTKSEEYTTDVPISSYNIQNETTDITEQLSSQNIIIDQLNNTLENFTLTSDIT